MIELVFFWVRSILSVVWKMELNECLHLCSLNCSSHVQPSFQALLHSAEVSLHKLFSDPERLLFNIRQFPEEYPTQDQLFHARLVGLTFCKFYLSTLLLPKEKEIQVGCEFAHSHLPLD